MSDTFQFQAETRQLLNILIHALYTEREIFLRELISNASDALNRLQFEQLTNADILDPSAELSIKIKPDETSGTLTISDTGIGMTRDEIIQNLGTIARSGAKTFLEALKDAQNNGYAQDIIGQFGVGFYSAFMVADKVEVVSRSFRPEAQAVRWTCDGGTSYTVEVAERPTRGTDVIIYLKEDAKEFLKTWTIKDIIRRHSDYVAFPIYVADDEEPTNKRTAIWRQAPNEVEADAYENFYKMLTLDFNTPLHHLHIRADVPMQFYALLYIPSNPEPSPFSPRREPGLKLYARKILIQDFSKDLLPEYLQFIQGVVDSEDLPLNVSRESVQANRIMANLKKTLTGRVLGDLKRMAQKDREKYLPIWQNFARYLKQGLVISREDHDDLLPLLFFHTSHDNDPQSWHSLDDYVGRMVQNQTDIYYVLADDLASASRSPHLDAFNQRGIEVLYFCDPIDAMLPMGLTEYKGHRLRSVDEADIDLRDVGQIKDEKPKQKPLKSKSFAAVRQRFLTVLGDRVKDVRESKTLVASPARLISDDNQSNRHMYRINRLLDRQYELPVKTLELNPSHPILHNLDKLLRDNPENPLINAVVEQLFETALLQDGLHPDPASMAQRLTLLMTAATGTPTDELDFTDTADDTIAEE